MIFHGMVNRLKALVTGVTGFLGQKLAARLISMGYEVTGIGRNKVIGDSLSMIGVRFISASLEDKEKVEGACKDQDFVFHCGALSSPWGRYQEFYQSNVLGTQNIISGCQKHSVTRLIHVSTPSLYFHFDERLNVKETDELPDKFVNHYAHTKYLAEKEIDRAFKEGLPVITIRPRAIFGPGDNAILPRLIKVCEKGVFPQLGDGNVEIDITYVENVVDALLLCMTSSPDTLGQKYNITNGSRVKLYDVIEDVMDRLEKGVKFRTVPFKTAFWLAGALENISRFISKKEPVLTRYTVSVLSQSQTLSIEKAQKELGYSPNISIEEGIKEFVDWWKTNNDN